MSIDDKNFSVYVTNFVGNLGTKILIEEKSELLLNKFSKFYLNKVHKDVDESLMIRGDNMSPLFIYDSEDIKKGGILTSLWIICDRNKLGLKYSLRDIPILQGTIEVANFFDINPYRLLTADSKVLLIDGDILDDDIKKYHLIKIGETNNEKQRLRIDGEVDAFLTKDYKDEIDKVINGRSKK